MIEVARLQLYLSFLLDFLGTETLLVVSIENATKDKAPPDQALS